MTARLLWGIDLGGTKIEGAVLDGPESVDPICRLRIPSESHLGYEHMVSRICLMLEMMEREAGATCLALGLGGPGTVDPATGAMKNCNTTCLNGRPLHKDLAQILKREVIVANDANCFALAEAHLGAARTVETVFGVILGTGVGGGIVIGGKVLVGAQGIAGEWGHNVLDPGGESCYCGKRGCVETVLSGPALERHYAALSGRSESLPRIVELAGKGDRYACQTINRLSDKFGEAISVVVNILDPDVIVLGGGVGNVDSLYTDGVESLRRWVFNRTVDTRILRPELGDSAGVFGAAHLTVGR